jgi:hypothetical protein
MWDLKYRRPFGQHGYHGYVVHATLHFGLKDLVTALKERRELVRERVLRALEQSSA